MSDYLDIRQGLWREEFAKALAYEPYLEASDAVHSDKWRKMASVLSIPGECTAALSSFTRKLNVLVYSGVWCGDCVRQGPMIELLGAQSDWVDVRFAERVEGSRLVDELRINGAKKVPVVVFLSEDFFELGRFGDRLLTVYRRMARDRLGPSCSTGLVPPPRDELEAELREWCDTFERMHIIVRLSPTLRQRYGD